MGDKIKSILLCLEDLPELVIFKILRRVNHRHLESLKHIKAFAKHIMIIKFMERLCLTYFPIMPQEILYKYIIHYFRYKGMPFKFVEYLIQIGKFKIIPNGCRKFFAASITTLAIKTGNELVFKSVEKYIKLESESMCRLNVEAIEKTGKTRELYKLDLLNYINKNNINLITYIFNKYTLYTNKTKAPIKLRNIYVYKWLTQHNVFNVNEFSEVKNRRLLLDIIDDNNLELARIVANDMRAKPKLTLFRKGISEEAAKFIHEIYQPKKSNALIKYYIQQYDNKFVRETYKHMIPDYVLKHIKLIR